MREIIERFKIWLITNRHTYEYWYDFIKTFIYYVGLLFLVNSLLGFSENLYYLRINITKSKFNYYTYETLQHLFNVLCFYYLTNKLKNKDGK